MPLEKEHSRHKQTVSGLIEALQNVLAEKGDLPVTLDLGDGDPPEGIAGIHCFANCVVLTSCSGSLQLEPILQADRSAN